MKLDNFEKSLIIGVEYYSIGSLISRTKERGKYHSDIKQVYAVSNVMGIIKAEDFRENAIQSDDTSNYTVIEPGMFAYNPSRLNIGSIAMLKSETAGLVSPMYVVFSVDESIITKEYFGYILETFYVKNKINSLKEEGARYRFDFDRWDLISIPVPPIEMQNEILRILDNFTALTAELTAELTARRKQYEYYKQLCFERVSSISVKHITDIALVKARVGWQRLSRSEYLDSGDYYLITGTDFMLGKINFENCVYVSKERYDMDTNIQVHKNDILITKDGTLGKVALLDKEPEKSTTLNSGVFRIKTNNSETLPKYLYYFFTSKYFTDFIESVKTGSTIPHLTQQGLISLDIPLPSLKEQQQIVTILDRFDELCNDISEGLPAEIEARQKQYEYYRDKLLTFKETESK